MPKSNASGQAILQLMFNATAWPNVADPASGGLTQLYVSLHTSDPGDAGTQNSNEISYTGYSRVAVPRSTGGWTVTNKTVVPVNTIAFGTMTGGTGGVATHAAVGTLASGAGQILYSGALASPIAVTNTITPLITTSSSIVEAAGAFSTTWSASGSGAASFIPIGSVPSTWTSSSPSDVTFVSGGPFSDAAIYANFVEDKYVGVADVNAFTVTRATTTSYAKNNSGSFNTFAANTPRRTDLGLYLEQSAGNKLTNPFTPATQTVTVTTATQHTLSVHGTGSATLSGAGSGTATEGNPLTFTTSGTSLTVTVSGTLTAFQVETGPTATSPANTQRLTETGATLSLGSLGPIAGPMTVYAEGVAGSSTTTQVMAELHDGTVNNRFLLVRTSNTSFGLSFNAAGAGQNLPTSISGDTPNALHCCVGALQGAGTGTLAICMDGGSINTSSPASNATGLTTLVIGMGRTANPFNGTIRRFALWKRKLTNAELQSVTSQPVGLIPPAAKSVYISPTGSDTSSYPTRGTEAAPWKTLPYAFSRVTAGDTIVLRGGTYTLTGSSGWHLSGSINNGTSTKPISIENYPGELPILDGSSMTSGVGSYPGSSSAGGAIISVWGASYLKFKGIEIKNGPMYGFYADSVHHGLVLDQVVSHHNGTVSNEAGIGIAVYGSGNNNQFLNCDAYLNGQTGGGNADGFQINISGSTGTYLYGCRSWQNQDDGYDFYANPAGAQTLNYTVDQCWAFENGLNASLVPTGGDGNGFKLGGQRNSDTTGRSGGHTITRCMAWGNYANGYDDNEDTQTGKINADTIYNCIAYNNQRGGGWASFSIAAVGVAHVLRNNISFTTSGNNNLSLGGSVVSSNNKSNSSTDPWNTFTPNFTLDSADFDSLSDTIARGARDADGSLPDSGFLRAAAIGDLVAKGTTTGLPAVITYSGAAPDLGAVQHV